VTEQNKELPIDPTLLKQANAALDKAKLQLISIKRSVFTTTILFSLKLKWDMSCPTANVDGVNLRINPQFFLDFSSPQRVFLLAHEAWHVAFEHLTRFCDLAGYDEDPKKSTACFKTYNEAADHVINNMLKNKGYAVPNGACCNQKYSNMSAEQVYNDLMKSKSQNPDFIPDFTPASNNSPDGEPSPTGMNAEQLGQKIDEMIVKANTASKMNPEADGSVEDVPDCVAGRIEELINPKVDWKTLLRNFMFDLCRDDYSYRRPNKRYMPTLIVPSLYSEGMGKISCGIDISGSVCDEQFNAFKSEIEEIKEALNPSMTEIVQWHHDISDITEIERYQNLDSLVFNDTGGTNVYPLLEHWIENPPDIAVIFTDGYFRPYDKPELITFPVIWVIYDNKKFTSDIGSVIEYELDLD
jgi:predicted metal-dependent peptidase